MGRAKVKILGLSCSQGEAKNTAWLVQYVLKATEEFGRRIAGVTEVKTEFVDLAGKDIKPFKSYYEWRGSSNRVPPLRPIDVPSDFGCQEEDDYMQELWTKMVAADGFIFGSPVSVGSLSSKFRILCERLTPRIAKGDLTNKPVVLVTVGSPLIGGQESCLRAMGNCIRELEMIDVSWKIGVPGVSSLTADIEEDERAKLRSMYSARRLVRIAVMQKLARQELGDLYNREFIQIYHDTHPGQPWFWEKLDKKDEEFLMSRENQQKGEYSYFKLEGED